MNTPVEEADEWSSPGNSKSIDKDSSLSYTKTPFNGEVMDSSGLDISERNDSDAIGAFDDNGHVSPENIPIG